MGAADEEAELVVFPELGVSGYVRDEVAWKLAEPVPGPSTEAVVAVAAEFGVTICFGLLEREADIVYNTQVLVNATGMIGKQRKIHMPGPEHLYWRGGFEVEVFDIGKARVGIMICYDSLFPEMARTLFFKGAEILIMPFAYSTGPRARFPEDDITALCYRSSCYQNGCFGVVCNNAEAKRDRDGKAKKQHFPGWAGVLIRTAVSWHSQEARGMGKRCRSQCWSPICLPPGVAARFSFRAPCVPRSTRIFGIRSDNERSTPGNGDSFDGCSLHQSVRGSDPLGNGSLLLPLRRGSQTGDARTL
jgi:predicted amidohydrolase